MLNPFAGFREEESGDGAPAGSAGGGTQTATAQPAFDQDKFVQAVADRFGATIDEKIKPIKDEITQTRDKLKEMEQPVADVKQFLGGGRAPAGISGPLPSKVEKQGYKMGRAAALAMRSSYAEGDVCKYEQHIHNKLYDHFVKQGQLSLGSKGPTLLVPMGGSCLPDDLDIKQEITQAMSDSVHGADMEELYWQAQRTGHEHMVRQALSAYDDQKLGIFTREGPQGDMIELLRNQEVFSRLGATQITLPASGRLTWPKQTSAMTAYWVGEGAEITSSEAGTGSIEIAANKLACLTEWPNELMRFATSSVEQFIRMDIARVMALKADRTFIDGAGNGNSPKGILNYSNILTVTAGTTGGVGDTLGPNDAARVCAALEDANHDSDDPSFAFVMRPYVWQDIYTRRADAVTASDEAGPYLFVANRANMANGAPTRWEGKLVVKSNQMPQDRVKSSATDLTCVLAGIFRHWMIARLGVMEFAKADQHSTNFAYDKESLRAIQHMTGLPRYENAFCLIDDLIEPS